MAIDALYLICPKSALVTSVVLVDIIIKDKHNKPGERITNISTNELDKIIKIEYNIKELERLLENE